ncbi:hypothetical protein KCP71_18610 [Salmonella enterica subsp. enterica]|nr:hypothetical protein KCP71_18610 [Salmonella enterica subsp. enterica]
MWWPMVTHRCTTSSADTGYCSFGAKNSNENGGIRRSLNLCLLPASGGGGLGYELTRNQYASVHG